MADAVTITIAAIDRTHVLPFMEEATPGAVAGSSVISIEETAPGVATMICRLWDMTNSITVNKLDPIVVTDPTTPGHNTFNGYVTNRKLTVMATYRIWELRCTDLNSWLDDKVVGAPNGSSFLQDPPGTYVAFDPNAVSQSSDAATVQWLFSVYAPDLPANTTTYVQTVEPNLGLHPVRWNTTTLRQALDEIASLTNDNLRYWIDPDWYVHWTISTSPTIVTGTAPGPLIRLFPKATAAPAAPYSLTDGVADGITTLNYEDDFEVEYDDQAIADSVYIDGATGYTYNPKTKKTGIGGSGWVNGATPTGRQKIFRETNSDSVAHRDSIGGTVLANANASVIKGVCTVVVNFGGWSTGQALNVVNTPAAINGTFMIQRVTTSFLSGTGQRRVTLEWGNAPKNSVGLRRNAQKKHPPTAHNPARRAATKLTVTTSASLVGAGGIVRAFAQISDAGGNAWPVAGAVVTWSVSAYDTSCNEVTQSTAWSLSATTSTTNIHGMAWIDLTTAATNNVTYYVTAEAEI